MSLRPHENIETELANKEEVEKGRERDDEAIRQIKGQRRWYEAETEKLRDPALKMEDLENDENWETHESSKKFDPEVFGSQTAEERRLDGEEQILASQFKSARMEEIARRKLEKSVDDVLNAKPTLEEKMANLTPEQHRKLFERLMKQ